MVEILKSKEVIILFFLTLIAAFDPVNGDLFNHLYYKYSKNLYMIVMEIVKNNEDTEDIIQDTYRKVYMNIKRFHGLDDESTIKLLTVYSRNTATDFIRKQSNKKITESLEYEYDGEEKTQDISDTSNLPDDVFIKKELILSLVSNIDNLSEPLRHTILLKYKYEMSNKEISKVLCISETAVSSRLNRARIALRKMMEVEYYE